jgi:hypothetical protein
MRSVAIRAILGAVDVDCRVVALLFSVALLAFPSAFANERSADAGWIVATHAMHRAHAGDAYAHVVVAFHAHPIDWLAKPFDFADVTTRARRSRQ